MSRHRERGSVFGRFSPEEDVDREIRSHLRLRAEELEREGWNAEDAEREAARLFGDRGTIADQCRRITERHDRAVRRAKMWDAAWQDIKYATRNLVRSPGFTVASVLTLALGIGANAAIFSVTYGVLLRPLPYEDPDALVQARETNNRGGPMSVAWANFLDWRAESRSFEAMTAYGAGSTTVVGPQGPMTQRVANVSSDFWTVFRVVPLTGRLTTPADHEIEAPPTVVISERLWRNELGELPLDDIALEIGASRAQVVGVVPDGFDFPGGSDVWGPAEPNGNTSRTSHNWNVVARLDTGTPIETAEQELDRLTRQIVLREPDADPDFLAVGANLVTLRERMVGASRTPLLLLFGAAGLVLLVACTNLASTLLARGTSRAREIAVRSSLGAGRGRVVRQLLTESLVLSGLGALAGVVVAAGVTRALRTLGPDSLPRVDAIAVDGTVVAFTAAVAVLAAVLFGLMPAMRLTRGSQSHVLREGGRGSVGPRGPIWNVLVGTEVALALVLLTGSGLLVRSFQQLMTEDLGFDGRDVVTVPIALSRVRYEDPQDHARWYEELVRELEALPAVRSAGIMEHLPAGGTLPNGRLELDGDLSKHAIAGYVVATSGAFEAFDIPLREGRHFGPQDTPDSEHVAIVSRSFADATWPGESAVGKQVTGGGMDNFWSDRRFARVVGVVEDVRVRDIAGEPYPTIYWPASQRPFRIQFGASLVVEAETGDIASIAPAVRATIERLDPDVPVELVPQEDVVADALATRRFMMTLLAGFSIVGLLLAAVGIYGVVSYSVARRMREMGIRVALGADPASVGRMVIASSMRLVVAGLVVGLVVSAFAARLLGSMLYEVAPFDPLTLVAVTAILTLTAFGASWVPARAGTRTDPMVTMRAE